MNLFCHLILQVVTPVAPLSQQVHGSHVSHVIIWLLLISIFFNSTLILNIFIYHVFLIKSVHFTGWILLFSL